MLSIQKGESLHKRPRYWPGELVVMGGVVNVAVVVVLTVGVAAVVNGASVVIDDDVKLPIRKTQINNTENSLILIYHVFDNIDLHFVIT